MYDNDDDPSNERSIVQIVVKTIFTHAFAVINYGQFGSLLPVPTHHNQHLFRVIIFTFLPALIIAQGAFDIIRALVRFLQDPDEAAERGLGAIPFYLFGILGVRATSDNYESESGKSESTKLFDLQSIDDIRRVHVPWTWKRFGRIAVAFLALAQALGTIVLFTRRADHRAVLGLDWRNLLMAVASSIASLATLALMFYGRSWVLTSEAQIPMPRASEMRRLAVEAIVSCLFMEFINNAIDYNNIGNIGLYPISLWEILAPRGLESMIVYLPVLAIIAFRHDIAKRLNIKLYPITTGLLFAACVWVLIDTIGILVVDIEQMSMHWDYLGREKWSDPWENYLPVI